MFRLAEPLHRVTVEVSAWWLPKRHRSLNKKTREKEMSQEREASSSVKHRPSIIKAEALKHRPSIIKAEAWSIVKASSES